MFSIITRFPHSIVPISSLKMTYTGSLMQITTARKAVTLLLSYLIFTKPLTEEHGTGLLLIAMGIVLKLLPDNKSPNRIRTLNSKSSSKEEKNQTICNEKNEEEQPLV